MRLLTYNIHKGIGGRDRRYRLQRIIDVVEEQNPDLICLQEVDRGVRRSRFDDQPELLAWYFRAVDRMYQLNVRLRRGGYGNLVLSRWPIRERHQLSLRLNRKKPRGAQLAVVETPEGVLHLVNFHLGLAAYERAWQIDHLLGHPLFKRSQELPTLLVGDYNDWTNALAHNSLATAGFAQLTAPPSRYRTFPAYLPMGSLDKAFARGSIHLRHARVVRNKLAHEASDHLPVVLDFHLERTGRTPARRLS